MRVFQCFSVNILTIDVIYNSHVELCTNSRTDCCLGFATVAFESDSKNPKESNYRHNYPHILQKRGRVVLSIGQEINCLY